MKISDCEVVHRYVRGCNVIFIFGPRAATAGEMKALAAEYAESYGAEHRPGYCSPDGWQALHAVAPPPPAPVAEEVPAAVPPIAAEDPAVAKPPKKPAK